MWLIFLITCIAVALACLAVIWIGNKVFLSIKRSNREFEQETQEKEIKNNEI